MPSRPRPRAAPLGSTIQSFLRVYQHRPWLFGLHTHTLLRAHCFDGNMKSNSRKDINTQWTKTFLLVHQLVVLADSRLNLGNSYYHDSNSVTRCMTVQNLLSMTVQRVHFNIQVLFLCTVGTIMSVSVLSISRVQELHRLSRSWT